MNHWSISSSPIYGAEKIPIDGVGLEIWIARGVFESCHGDLAESLACRRSWRLLTEKQENQTSGIQQVFGVYLIVKEKRYEYASVDNCAVNCHF